MFAVPKEDVELVLGSGLFDAKWYIERYPDVRALGLEPIEHYLAIGARLRRNPSPNFDSIGYLRENVDVAKRKMNPLLHYARWGKREGRPLGLESDRQLIAVPGSQSYNDAAHTIAVCGHSAGSTLFGSERSFLDMVIAVSKIGYNVIVILPKNNPEYTKLFEKYALAVYVFRYYWWNAALPLDGLAVNEFAKIFQENEVDAVHVNTIMLREPLIAAKNCGLPSIVHIRELISQDETLLEAIGETAEVVRQKVVGAADFVAANSAATAADFDKGESTFVIPNVVDVDRFDIPNEIAGNVVRFGLISSNISKKGVRDVVELARLCEKSVPRARFILIGPPTDYIRRFESSGVNLPKNIEIAGYMEDSCEAISHTNVILNFSHFGESFGRTILEGMAARRPSIAYAHGALPELIEHQKTGYLIPLRQPAAAVEYVRLLVSNPKLVSQLGENGRRRSVERYSQYAYREKMRLLYDSVLKNRAPKSQANATGETLTNEPKRLDSRPNPPIADVSVVVPNYNYYHYMEERIQSILNQTVRPKEIIFLDDCSTDGSVALAERLLSTSEIPFRIEKNIQNQGTYRQWLKGIAEAKCELIWIAEADDTCDPEMLSTLVDMMKKETTVIAYCQSKRLDQNGQITAENCFHHTNDIDAERWKHDYEELGVREVVDSLFYRNTIPNVSACLLRKSAISGIEDRLKLARFCGDHFLYCHMLKSGNVAYSAKALNGFRRHVGSVTRKAINGQENIHEIAEVRKYISENFPIHQSQLPVVEKFINKDYSIPGVPKNSDIPFVKSALLSVREHAAANLRIFLLTTNNGSYTGGSEVLWREAAFRMRRRGIDVAIAIKKWEPAPPFLPAFEQAGIKVFFRDGTELSAIRRFKPDIVVISIGDQDEGIEYYEALRADGIKYVIVNHLTKQPEYWPIREHKTALVQKGYAGAETVFFTSWNNHRVMEGRLNAKISNARLFYNPLDVDRSIALPFPSTAEGIQLAMPSRLLCLHKGQHLALQILARDKWKLRNWTLNLYGDGPDKQRLEAQIAEYGLRNVKFHSRVNDLSDVWRVNHAILMPSFMEGLPIVLTGAMLARRVPIVTDVGGHAELIVDNESGFIARAPTVDDVDEAMERAYRRIAEWESIGRCAREAVLKFLPEDTIGDFVEKMVGISQGTSIGSTDNGQE